MREPNYFVEAVETRRGRRLRYWRQQLKNLAVAFAVAVFALALMAGCIDAYATLASPFPIL